MAVVLTKEDGTGKPDANSYADVADGDAYFEGHLYADAWTGATAEKKAAALVMATRLIDSQYQFNGFRAHTEQALQWPREKCPDPDKGLPTISVLQWVSDYFVEPDLVPVPVVRASCEMARELLIVDRTAAPAGEGIGSTHTGFSSPASGGTGFVSQSNTTTYSKGDTRPIVSHVAQAMLSKFGALVDGGSGAVRLVRA
jgi:hypothetical protein